MNAFNRRLISWCSSEFISRKFQPRKRRFVRPRWKMVFLRKTFKFPQIKSRWHNWNSKSAYNKSFNRYPSYSLAEGWWETRLSHIRCPTTFKFLVISASQWVHCAAAAWLTSPTSEYAILCIVRLSASAAQKIRRKVAQLRNFSFRFVNVETHIVWQH